MPDFHQRTILTGSDRKPPGNSQAVGPVQPEEEVSVTVVLRRKGPDPAIPLAARPSPEQFTKLYGADPADIALVEEFAAKHQLRVVASSVAKRSVVLSGTATAVSAAFGTSLVCYRHNITRQEFRGRTGPLMIPVELEPSVIAVLGLDNRPAAEAHFRLGRQAQAAAGSAVTFTPPQVAALYNFPTELTGTGQTIAIIELGGGYDTSDLQTYFNGLGVTAPKVSTVSVDGGNNSPGTEADPEVMLDIEVAGSIAYGANIVVYFAPNTDQGFIDAISDAVHDQANKPSVISISWGAPEDSWTQQSQTAMNSALQDAAALGVTVTVASGDNGSSDGQSDGQLHTDFPACSPYSLACGGTTLVGSGDTISSEAVWNEVANNEGATGGGVSTVFALPSYQSSVGVPKQPQTGFAGRGTPDVAGNADPSTGYQVRFDGQNQVIGGTSAVAPLWAGLAALLNEKLGTAVGFLNPKLYALNETGFHDILSGNNDDSGLGYYSAGPGWDPCTGLGSPDGTGLLNALTSGGSGSSS